MNTYSNKQPQECNKNEYKCESKYYDVIKIKIYCLKCRKHTNSNNDLEKINLGYTIQIKTHCSECKAKKCRFIAKEDEDKIEI